MTQCWRERERERKYKTRYDTSFMAGDRDNMLLLFSFSFFLLLIPLYNHTLLHISQFT